MPLTRSNLLEQTRDSRERNILHALDGQFDRQFGVRIVKIPTAIDVVTNPACIDASLAEVGFVGTVSGRVADIVGREFPFVSDPHTLVARATTFKDLVRLILEKVGA